LPKSPEGKVELDALEALYPGELEKIVRRAIGPYLDRTIHSRLGKAEDQALALVDEEWSDLMREHEKTLLTLRRKVESVVKGYQKQVAALNKRMLADLSSLGVPAALKALKQEVKNSSKDFLILTCQSDRSLTSANWTRVIGCSTLAANIWSS
jgi:hypothetical protein